MSSPAAQESATTRDTAGAARADRRVDRIWLLVLTALALLTRLGWVLALHRPQDHVFRDMRAYLVHAQWLVAHGLEPWPAMAFQPLGTSALLALPLALFDVEALTAAAVFWGLLAAAQVPLAYLLARAIGSRRWIAPTVGVAALVWLPSLSYAGLFTSETPYATALLLACWLLTRLTRAEARWPAYLAAGSACAVGFSIRPQIAVALLLIAGFAGLAALRRRFVEVETGEPPPFPGLRAGTAAAWLLPLALAGAVSLLWVRHQVGHFAGVATASTINLALGRCHLTRVQFYEDLPAMIRSRSLEDGRVVGAPALWDLGQRFADANHPYALRPAFGVDAMVTSIDVDGVATKVRVAEDGLALKVVGARDDVALQRGILRACWQRTSFAGQLRYGVQNLSLLALFNDQWPDGHGGRESWRRLSSVFAWIFALLLLPAALLGLRAVLARGWTRPEQLITALQLLGLMIVAAVVFGSLRIRVPHDVLWLWLACEGVLELRGFADSSGC